MAEVNVLVVFYSRYGKAERIALAAGVGAIQAKANIRLRRVADLADADTIESDAAWRENLERMNMDYVVPRPADPAWADVIVLVAPAYSSKELETFVESLPFTCPVAGKIAAPLSTAAGETTIRRLSAAATAIGLSVAPSPSDSGDEIATARAYGRAVADMARATKS
jgi:NAD(P)H dehydrogenase (quinone)